MCRRILTRAHSTGKKRLKRSEPLLLELWIVMLSLFVLFFQCGHSWAFWRAARHDPTRVVSAKTNIHFCVQSNSENRPHTLADSTCTTVRNNTNAACQFADAYTGDCGTVCAPNARASTSLQASCTAGTLQNSQGFGVVWGTNAAGIHLPDGSATVVFPRLSRDAASIYLERQRDPPASSIRFRRFLFNSSKL